jgi:hypothetical protein
MKERSPAPAEEPAPQHDGIEAPDRADGLRIAVVRNPRSHRNRGVVACLDNSPGVTCIEPNTREALSAALEKLALDGVDILIIDGGDGTVRDVLTRGLPFFGTHWPKLMVLPQGKTNALAVDLGATRRLTLEEAVTIAPAAGTVIRRPMLIEREDADAPPVMGFIMGAGAFTVAIDAGQTAHKLGAFQGLAVAITVAAGVVQALFGFGRTRWRERVAMRIFTGPGQQELPNAMDPDGGRRFASGYSTLKAFPIGMKPFADIAGDIRYLVFDKPLRRAMALAPAVLMGLDRPFLKKLGIHRGAAEEILIELGGSFILDGEAFPPGRYRLRLGPELAFCVP